ncbi:MAG: MarR family transcriptional regulator [Cellulomonas sp.]|jgi:DNA-binding MarR family transcriptional regulator|nr:MarR family transcriptional regulator [Cellulomonas sp.]
MVEVVRVSVAEPSADVEAEREAHELRRALGLAARRVRAERGSADLPDPQFNVLALLAAHGVTTPGRLAELERVRPPSMTRTVACLADRGLVVKEEDPHDGRQVLVALTAAGRAEVAETRRRRDAWLSRRLAEMTPEDRACLARAAGLLRRMAQS